MQLVNRQPECFVDASDELDEAGQLADSKLDDKDQAQDGEQQTNLKVRLEETAQILRMALSNEFIKALDICAKR